MKITILINEARPRPLKATPQGNRYITSTSKITKMIVVVLRPWTIANASTRFFDAAAVEQRAVPVDTRERNLVDVENRLHA